MKNPRSLLFVLPLAFCVTSASAAPCDMAASDRKVAEGEVQTDIDAMKRLGQEAIALCDTNPRAHNLLGNALETLGDIRGARTAYDRAAALDPSWYVPALGLGDLARKSGAPEEARSAYAKALGLVRSSEERAQVESSAALLPPPQPSAGYAFKDADAIERGFRIGERLTKVTSGAAPAEGGAATGGIGRSGGVVTEAAPWEPAAGKPTSPGDSDIVQASDGRIGSPLSVEFLVGSTGFTDQGRLQAEALATGLGRKRTGAERFVIEGHASTDGDAGANLELSKLRAAAFRDFLVSKGMDAAQFEVRGFGETHPIIENGVENKEKSRRVVLVRNADR